MFNVFVVVVIAQAYIFAEENAYDEKNADSSSKVVQIVRQKS